jgi:sulfate adenylyltransferase subunit 2
MPEPHTLDHLDTLEAEAVQILRETVAQFERPGLLFSGGKDSIVLAFLSRKAFRPGRIPYPFLHIDTGHNFPETLTYRDWLVEHLGANLETRSVQDSIDAGLVEEETGKYASRNALQTRTLLDAIEELRLDAAIGGARRDEEKARAKERIFSARDAFGQWEPRLQRPELWDLYNGRVKKGEHMRIFPISNWTELDVWNYIRREQIPLPSIYFAHERKLVRRDGLLYPDSPFLTPDKDDEHLTAWVRFRTVGDMTCTAAVESRATELDEVIEEIRSARVTERGARIDDKRSSAAMEDRKRGGYF